MWYGTGISNDKAVNLAPYQNATGLQVTSSVLAAMVCIIENPNQGLVQANQMHHARCLEVQKPYLGRVECHYTNWTPITHPNNNFARDRDDEDPWHFTNFFAKCLTRCQTFTRKNNCSNNSNIRGPSNNKFTLVMFLQIFE